MGEQLKNLFFTIESVNHMADTIGKLYPGFDRKKFLKLVYDDTWEKRELKEKMSHLTLCLHQTLPESYKESLEILKKAAPVTKGFEALVLPDYVALYGMDDWDLSLPALYLFTKYSSSELAIRPFLKKDPEKVMKYMAIWAEDGDPKVRRLASEGSRPRLPWAMAIPQFKKDPAPILPILEKLKNDPSETVRRSVANNLNDISKDHPELVLEICEKWTGQNKHTDKIVKHACRTMLKAGNKRALILFEIGDPSSMFIEHFTLDKESIKLGEYIHFSFDLISKEKGEQMVRLEYALYFMKANGKLAKKVFKIAENKTKPGKHSFRRKHLFRDMTTRKHYGGKHQISIIVNGEEKIKTTFTLKTN